MLWVLFFKMDGPLLYCQRALTNGLVWDSTYKPRHQNVSLTAKFWVKGGVDE